MPRCDVDGATVCGLSKTERGSRALSTLVGPLAALARETHGMFAATAANASFPSADRRVSCRASDLAKSSNQWMINTSPTVATIPR